MHSQVSRQSAQQDFTSQMPGVPHVCYAQRDSSATRPGCSTQQAFATWGTTVQQAQTPPMMKASFVRSATGAQQVNTLLLFISYKFVKGFMAITF